MVNGATLSPSFHTIRHDRLLQEQRHDAYRQKGKLPEPSVCSQCHAVFAKGRWCWEEAPEHAYAATCPACAREEDHFPAGFVNLKGQFFMDHRSEIMSLVHHEALRAKKEHPLQRIMEIEEQEDGVMITTTDIHLARSFGEAVHRAYQGELEFHYNAQQMLLRVRWTH